MVVYSILGEGRSPSGSIINYPHRWRGDEGWIERVLFGPRFEKLSLRGWICFCFGKRNFGLGSGLGRFGGEGRLDSWIWIGIRGCSMLFIYSRLVFCERC